MGVVGDVGGDAGDDVVEYDHFEGDEINCRDFESSDKEEEPVEDGNYGLWEEDEICSCYGCNGAACPDDGRIANQCVADATKDGAGEIEADVAYRAELIVNVVAEEVEEEHVSDNMHEAAVEEGVSYEVLDAEVIGVEHEPVGPQTKGGHYEFAVDDIPRGAGVCQEEDYHIDGDNGVVRVRRSPGPDTRSDR